jgi:hypothetical protein
VVAGPVTPQFSVTDAVGVTYYSTEPDGSGGFITDVFTPGTSLSLPGLYRVWAVADGAAGPQERIMAGVDFTIVASPAVPAIAIARDGDNLVVTWSGGRLEESTDLTSWVDAPDQVSPLIIPTGGEQQRGFYRVAVGP